MKSVHHAHEDKVREPFMRTAVATFGFGRPDHFERMLTALGKCPEIVEQKVDLYHFLDGGLGSEQDALVALIHRSTIPFKEIILRPENYGVGRQLISARREILDEQGYDRMVLVEDDVEVNHTYFTVLFQLSDWAQQFQDTGTVQVWNVEQGSREQLEGHLGEVELTNRHFVTYCITKRVWDQIKSILYEYEAKYLLGRNYGKRPHYRIRYFMKKKLKQRQVQHSGTLLAPPSNALSAPFPAISWRFGPTSQDAITSLSMYLANLHRLTTRVPHAYYFGVTGVHCTPEVYAQMGFNDQGWWQWGTEDLPTDFTMRYQDAEGRWLKSVYR